MEIQQQNGQLSNSFELMNNGHYFFNDVSNCRDWWLKFVMHANFNWQCFNLTQLLQLIPYPVVVIRTNDLIVFEVWMFLRFAKLQIEIYVFGSLLIAYN